MKFSNLRKVVASTLAASVVLTSTSALLTSFTNEANAYPKVVAQDDQEGMIQYGIDTSTDTSELNGKWKITWKTKGFLHVASLNLKDGSGKMHVKVFKGKKNIKTVVQDVIVSPDNPDGGSYSLHAISVNKPGYNLDNFRLEDNGDGTWNIEHDNELAVSEEIEQA